MFPKTNAASFFTNLINTFSSNFPGSDIYSTMKNYFRTPEPRNMQPLGDVY